MNSIDLKHQVKSAARGRWREILEALGFPPESIEGSHHRPCPKCPDHGTDRYRPFADVDETGGVFCNQCHFEKNGDGFAALSWLNEWTFVQSLQAVADYLNLTSIEKDVSRMSINGTGVGTTAIHGNEAFLQSVDELRKQFIVHPSSSPVDIQHIDDCFHAFAAVKPPITLDAIKAAGGLLVTWPISKQNGNSCIAIPAYVRESEVPAAYLLRRVDGNDFEKLGNLASRKTHTLGGSTKAWLILGGFQRLRQAQFVLRVEGEADALAVWQFLPSDWAVVTNTCGAKAVPDNLSIFAGKTIYSLGDADTPGQAGAIKFANKVQTVADRVKHPQLPYEIEQDHGKDLRDYFNDGHTFEELRGICENSPDFRKSEVADEPVSEASHLSRLKEVLALGAEFFFRDSAILNALASEAVDNPPSYMANKDVIKKSGVGMRDFEVVMRPLIEAIRANKAGERDINGGYFIDEGRICREKKTLNGSVTVPICNFVATIADETVRDNGAEQFTSIGVQVVLSTGRTTRITIDASQFSSPEKWVIPQCGTDAIIWAGEDQHVAPAIQALSRDKIRTTEFSHTGWRKLSDDEWGYLHRRGAITTCGNRSDIRVSLDAPLDRIDLPDPPSGSDLVQAIQASLEIVDVAPAKVTIPLLAACYRSVMGPCDFSMFLAGLTGVGKSEIAALIQQHFGTGLDARHLPASWSSTDNSLEVLAFAAKDVILVIDDFNPIGNSTEVSRFHTKADRVLRSQGNASGRQRLGRNSALQPTKYPRGLILSTGEDIPTGHSLRARMFILEVSKGDISFARLTKLQKNAIDGLYSRSVAGFLKWMAPNYNSRQEEHRSEVEKFRSQVSRFGDHARTSSLAAELLCGWDALLEFALSAGAINSVGKHELFIRGVRSMVEVAGEQSRHHDQSNPVLMFQRMVGSALSSGRAHIADRNGDAPVDAERWGWRRNTGEYEREQFVAQGSRIGWVTDEGLYLEPAAAFSVVQGVAHSHGTSLPVSEQMLWKRMKETGALASWDDTRKRNTVRRNLGGTRHEVLHIVPEPIIGPAGESELSELTSATVMGRLGRFPIDGCESQNELNEFVQF